ncbi:E3 ubiquitin-protein ligase ubr5 [Tyrophagus putrescentiae]|nr:E3 ubiquitin-protein ligase ubr5 [Tyrophagus putrescentiae]
MSSSSGPNNPGGGGDAHQPPPPPRSLASTAAAMAAAAGASYHGNQLVFVVNPLPSTEEQLNERILDSAERLRSQSTTNAAGSNNNNSQTSAAPNPIPVITIRDDQTLSTSTSSGGLTSDLMTNNDEPSSSPWTTAFSSSQSSPFLHSSQGPSTSTAAESVEQQQQQMPRPSVLQCVISHGYVAVLLEDHRVCRFQYNIYPERIANAESSSKSNSLVAGGGSSSARTVQTARRRLIRHSARGPRGGPGGSASATAASVIMGHRGAVIPAQFVPEDLINQAQVVLQGKSRNVIIRELQRTNLDVNLAVNNLLSRDDEEYDDGDDGGPEQMIQSDDLMSLLDSGFGPNESVIIDSDFADEVFSYPLRIRSSSSALFNSGSSSAGGAGGSAGSASGNAPPTIRSARESRLRDEAFSFIERDFMSGGSGTGGGGTGSGSQKSRWYSYPVEKGAGGCFDSLSTRQRPLKTSSSTSAARRRSFGPRATCPERKFVAIASLTSELIAITAKGELCQWRWADAEPFRGQLPDGTPYWHPRAPALGLMAPAEKVTLVAGSCIRATVATESGKLATWIDESIAPVASKLEHPATSSIFESGSLGGSTSSLQSLHHHHHHHQLHHTQQQQQQHRITSLHVSSLMSVVQLSSGAIYWWGVPPFAHRKKLVEKVKNERNGGGSNSASKSASKSSSKSSSTTSKQQQQQEEIVLGSLVCMRNSPLYQAGSIAFTTVGGLPKVGQLVNSAWKITDSCSFRVLSPAEIAARAPNASIGKASTTTSAAASTSSIGKTGASSEDLSVNSKTVEMPPPPSPASSTSSEPGGYSSGAGPLPKRAKRSSNNSGGSGSGGATAAPENSSSSSSRSSSGEGANQQQGAQAIDRVEMWSLKDIVFMEDVRNLPVGRVIKVDGNYVAVKFTGGQGTTSSSSSSSSASTSAMLGEAIPPGSSLAAAAEHSLLFQAAMMGGGDQRGGGNSGGSFSPGGPRSSSSQGGGGGGGGGSSASSTDSMKTGAGGGGSQAAAESFTFENFMQDCRLMRKDELTVVKPTALPTATSTTTSAASTSAAGASASTSAPSVQGTTTSSAASPINITGGNGSSQQNQQQTQQQQQQTGAANPLGSKAANDCLQRAPKRVHLPENVQILAMTLSNLGLHCIAKIGGYRFSYILVNIVTGRVESDAKIPIEYSTFFGSAVNSGKVPVSSSKIALYSAGETDSTTVVLCRDGNGTLYPLAKDCTETLIRDPIALNLGPVSTIGLGIFGLPGSTANSSSNSSSNSSKTHAAIVGLAFEPQLLMSAILKSDLDLVRARLEMLEAAPAVFGPMVGELCDGNHNILHIAVSACFPTSNKTGGGGGNGSSTSSTSSASTTSAASSGAGASAAGAVSSATTAAERLISNMFESDEILNLQVMSLDQAENSSNSSSSNKDKDTSASTEQQQSTPMDTSNSQTQQTQQQNHHHQHHNSADYIAEPPLDPSEQKPIAHSILWTLLDSPALQPYLLGLLSARDFNGLTPFMFAVSGRAYSAAIQLLLIMQRVARQAAVGAMAGFDQGSSLYSVYLTDLVKRTLETMLYPRGSLPDHSPLYMLCSNDTCSFTWTGEEHINQDIFECRTCGLGHDCKLKRTSPTAYCDCWEKCKCKALIGGCQPARFALLKRLLEATDLSLRPNARGEHLLLFLVQTVGRQIGEQRQYRPARVISGPVGTLGW